MMKGVLIYNRADALKNEWFIGHLMEAADICGIRLELLIHDEQVTNPQRLPAHCDFCINRTRRFEVSLQYEKQGVRCYNPSSTVKAANDKWLTYQSCRNLGIEVMPTVRMDGSHTPPYEYPFIIKARNGHGGSEVFWIKNEKELQAFSFRNPGGYIAQEPASNLGLDVRIYVLGGRPLIGVKRTSSVDFRSNYSLGGSVELFSPTKEQVLAIETITSRFPLDYAGVDFLLHNGTWVLNEIEDAVGSRMLYSLWERDIGMEWIAYILQHSASGIL